MTSSLPQNVSRNPAGQAATKEEKTHKSYRPGMARVRQLLDVATALFVEKGVAATTIDDIATSAGIAKGTFYHYYESKQALLIALQEDYGTSYNNFVLHAVEQCPQDDLNARLRAWIKASFSELIRTMRLCDVLFTDPEMFMHWSVSREPFMRYLVNLFQQGNRQKVWQIKHPELTAIILYHGMVGVVDDAILRGANPRQLEPKIHDFVHQLCIARHEAR